MFPLLLRRLLTTTTTTTTTDYIKSNINNTHQNNKCRLCGDRDETVDDMMNATD